MPGLYRDAPRSDTCIDVANRIAQILRTFDGEWVAVNTVAIRYQNAYGYALPVPSMGFGCCLARLFWYLAVHKTYETRLLLDGVMEVRILQPSAAPVEAV